MATHEPPTRLAGTTGRTHQARLNPSGRSDADSSATSPADASVRAGLPGVNTTYRSRGARAARGAGATDPPTSLAPRR